MSKLAAEEPDARGVKWLRYADRFGTWPMSLPRSLACLGRESSEKWAEPRRWSGVRVTGKRHKLPSKQRPDGTVAGGWWLQGARLQVVPAEDRSLPHRPVPEVDGEPAHHQVLVVPVQDPGAGGCLQELPPFEGPAEDPVVEGAEGEWKRKGSVHDPGPPRRCEVQPGSSGLLSTTDMGRRVPAPAEEDEQNEVSEWGLRERQEREEGRRREAEEHGAEDKERQLFLPTASSMASAEEE
jgi:hypothetical protein